MSKNALALVDCNTRDVLFQYISETFDRKASKNEMVSPYDDQLIGKMNFRYGGMEHSMFFTYAKSSEYPGKRFRNRKILYLSLGVNDISSDIFNQICATFGGFVIYDDDVQTGWRKIDRMKVENDPWQAAMEEAGRKEKELLDIRPELRQMLRMDEEDEDAIDSRERERDKESRDKEGRDKEGREPRRKEHHRSERKRNGEKPEKADKSERAEKAEGKPEGKNTPKQEAKAERAERREDGKAHHPKENQKDAAKDSKGEGQKESQRDGQKDGQKDGQQRRPHNHHRNHRPRGPRKDGAKPEAKQGEAKTNKPEKPASAE